VLANPSRQARSLEFSARKILSANFQEFSGLELQVRDFH
jgi:hypothetical protein